MNSSQVQYTREEVVANLKNLLEEYGAMTRDLYRKLVNALPERVWKQHFTTFTEFLDAAMLYKKPDNKNEERNVFTANSWNIDLPKTRIHTLDQLLEYCQVDLAIWEVERFVVNKWEVGAKNSAKELKVEPLYQVKATLKKKENIVAALAEINALKADILTGYKPVKNSILTSEFTSGNMLEINIPDAHFGKMAWGKETQGRSYDTPIAAATFDRALETLIERSKGFKFEKILFVVGNDLLNSDNELGTTTKGTAVSTDCRYQKTFVTVRRTIVKAINRLKEIAPVHVVLVSGNHDDLGVWHLGDSLECAFDQEPDVLIDNAPTYRKYVRFGNVLLMLTHGDKGKREDYPLLMATERSKDFGETKFREIHTGHIHQTKLQEWHGVRVRILPSLSPPDAWHSENGFVEQQRNAEAYVWNTNEGLIAQFFHNDDAYPEITTDRILKEG